MEDYYPEYINFLQAFKAFLCGSIIISSILVAISTENEFLTLAALMLTVIGILFLIDTLLPFDKMLHFFTVIFSVVAGVIASFIVELIWNSIYYLAITFVLIILIYVFHILKRKS
jgi:hypothetical protein